MNEPMLESILDLGKNAYLSSKQDVRTSQSGELTLSFWMHVNAIDERANVISKTHENQVFYALSLFREDNTNKIALDITQGETVFQLSAPVPNLFGQWVQVTLRISQAKTHSAQSKVCVLINGECVAQGEMSQVWQDGTGELLIGRGMNGHIWDVRRWQRALSAEQIQGWSSQWITGTEPDLLSWFGLTQTQGLTELAYRGGASQNVDSAEGLEGTLIEWTNAALPYVPQTVNALHLDRAEEHVAITGLTDFPQQRFTVEFWYRSYHATSQSVLMEYIGAAPSEDGPSAQSEQVALKIHNPLALTVDIAGASLKTDLNLVTGRWTHVAITWHQREGKTRIFIDGEPQGKQARIPPSIAMPEQGRVFIGSDHQLRAPGLGSYLADFRVWSTGRSRHEIDNNRLFRLEGDEFPLYLYYPLSQYQGNVLATPLSEVFLIRGTEQQIEPQTQQNQQTQDAQSANTPVAETQKTARHAQLTGGRWQGTSLVIQPSPAEQLRTLRARAALYQPPVENEEPSKGEPIANVGLAFETKDFVSDFAEQLAQVQTSGFALTDVKLEAAVLLSTETNKVIIPYTSSLQSLDPGHYSKIELNFTPSSASGMTQNLTAPNLIGSTDAYAQSYLVNAGIAFETLSQNVDDPQRQGTVIAQQPDAGETLSSSKPMILIIGTSYNA